VCVGLLFPDSESIREEFSLLQEFDMTLTTRLQIKQKTQNEQNIEPEKQTQLDCSSCDFALF
jgi:hypothetical protein